MENKAHPALYKRQKMLLTLLDAFGSKLPNVDMQKYLFLFAQHCETKPSYEFIPYRFGCFSFQSYADRRKLIEFGFLANSDEWELINSTINADASLMKKANLFAEKYRNIKGDKLVKHVYERFPYYAIHSEIAERLLDTEKVAEIEKKRPTQNNPEFFTIGYEGQSFENYLNRLIKNNIKLLCDVRKNPLSRKYGFSKKTLSETLNKIGIKYIHLPELGIVSDKRQQLNSQSDYNLLFKEYEATTLEAEQDTLNYLYQLVTEYSRVAITCFEAEHCMCHRSKVAENLSARADWNYPVSHI